MLLNSDTARQEVLRTGFSALLQYHLHFVRYCFTSCLIYSLLLRQYTVYTSGAQNPIAKSTTFCSLHVHPFYLVCPEENLVGEPLSGDGCGSPNHI